MSQPTIKEVLFNPVFNNNPIGLQILGICSALAVTSNLKTALVMSIALTLVVAFSYIVETDGELDTLVLPVRGYGLWSTLYGFLALQEDLNTVAGLGFYQHGETPGLGGEVDNPKWRSLWEGKKLYNEDGELAIQIVKGGVDPQSPNAKYRVDALAGATLTSNGVNNLLHFWLGENGFGPFIANLRAGEA